MAFIKCESLEGDNVKIILTRDIKVQGGYFQEGTIMKLTKIEGTLLKCMQGKDGYRLHEHNWPLGIWYILTD